MLAHAGPAGGNTPQIAKVHLFLIFVSLRLDGRVAGRLAHEAAAKMQRRHGLSVKRRICFIVAA